MRRGQLSGQPAPELWVEARALFEVDEPSRLAFWRSPTRKVRPLVKEWLYTVLVDFNVLLVWVGEDPVPVPELDALVSRKLHFGDMVDALASFRTTKAATEFLTVDFDVAGEAVRPFKAGAGRYRVRR